MAGNGREWSSCFGGPRPAYVVTPFVFVEHSNVLHLVASAILMERGGLFGRSRSGEVSRCPCTSVSLDVSMLILSLSRSLAINAQASDTPIACY